MSSKIASTEWDRRRKDGVSSVGRNGRDALRGKGNSDSSIPLDGRGRGYQSYVSDSERSYAEVVYGDQKQEQVRDHRKSDKNFSVSWMERNEERD